MYQTVRYEIKEGHDMYHYCQQVCRSFKNMYNVTNFYIRQLLTGFNKLEDKRTPNEQDADMGKKNNQAFASLPLQKFVRILETVSGKYRIKVYEQEESYTSKADFLCRDEIPVYKKEGSSRPVFSGRREKRGLYASGCGKLVNADVNAAFNIARKCFGDEAFAGCREGCMDSADAWNYRDFYPLRKKTNWASQPIA